MKYFYKATILAVIHLLYIFLSEFFFPLNSAFTLPLIYLSPIASILYIFFGYKSYKYENMKIGGGFFVIAGSIALIQTLLLALIYALTSGGHIS